MTQLLGTVSEIWRFPFKSMGGETLSHAGGESLLRVPDVEALTRLLAAVQRVGGQVTSIWPRRRTLEDIFLEEVGKTRGEGGAAWKP